MTYLALLRGINVGGKNKVPMKELQSLCAGLGWKSVETYLQTGNVVFKASESAASLESDLEKAIESRFGFPIPVVVRSAKEFIACVAESPLKKRAETDPSRTLLYLTKRPIQDDALASLESRAAAGESLYVSSQSLWIYFPEGVGTSKLSPAVIDRAVGSNATGRNWNTITKICEMLDR